METFNEILERIVKTATVSYYSGCTVKVEVEMWSDTSYFNPMENKIVVSGNNIFNAIKYIKGKEIKDIDELNSSIQEIGIEKLTNAVRGFLYHEVSHVMLTPYNLYNVESAAWNRAAEKFFNQYQKELSSIQTNGNFISDAGDLWSWTRRELNVSFMDIINIFEDQRIETINKGYFLNVDFRETLKQTNPEWQKTISNPPESVTSMFFEIVRFQNARNPRCKMWVNRINDIIYDYFYINAGDEYDCDHPDESPSSDLIDMYERVFYIMLDVALHYFKNGQPQQIKDSDQATQGNGQGQGQKQQGQGQGSGQGKQAGGGDGQTQEAGNGNGGESSSGETKQKADPRSNIAQAREDAQSQERRVLNKMKSEYHPETVKDTSRMYPLVNALKKKLTEKYIAKSLNKKGSMTYSGKLKVRYLVRPHMNEGKVFYRENPEGGTRGLGSKKRINLWLDWSGSYSGNCKETNKVISIMCDIEKHNKNFDFNVIAMGGRGQYRTKLLDKSERCSQANGGTDLNGDKVRSIYNQLNGDPTIKTINIVLFDGTIGRDAKSLSVFNNKKSYFIVDYGVEYDQRPKYAPNAYSTSVENDSEYPVLLAKNLAKALSIIL